jgi:toxin ParE1/3/4
VKFSVQFTLRVQADIVSLHEYISANSSAERADAVVIGIESLCGDLVEFPLRGHFPPELEGHQRGDIRELRFKPYRIVYRVKVSRVEVLAVFDGRRDARALLDERLLRN